MNYACSLFFLSLVSGRVVLTATWLPTVVVVGGLRRGPPWPAVACRGLLGAFVVDMRRSHTTRQIARGANAHDHFGARTRSRSYGPKS